MSVVEDKARIIVSEGILQDGTFGAYLLHERTLPIEYRLVGGCSSIKEARATAKEILDGNPKLKQSVMDTEQIEYRKRPSVQIDSAMQLMSENDLEESIRKHFERCSSNPKMALRWEEIIKDLISSPLNAGIKLLRIILSIHSAIFLVTCFAIWLYWTNGSVSVPKDVDLPFLGHALGGKIVNAPILARYFPLVLLALYTGAFLQMIKINMQYDHVRRQILSLVVLHGWRYLDFARMIQTQIVKSGYAWFVSVLEGIHDKDPATLANLRKLPSTSTLRHDAKKASTPGNTYEGREVVEPDEVQAELSVELLQWLPSEFERRIHNLYFIDKESDYSRYVICFDPLIYVMSLNRVIFRAYEFLREKGVEVDPYNTPRDPYLTERVPAPVFWFIEFFRMAFFGSIIVWSFIIAGHQLNTFFIANVLAALLVLLLPGWWNFLAKMKKRGFPKTEPLGAYTVGPMTSNRISIL